MNRRRLLALPFGALVLAAGPRAFATGGHVEYSRDAYEAALASGKPFMLDFFASW